MEKYISIGAIILVILLDWIAIANLVDCENNALIVMGGKLLIGGNVAIAYIIWLINNNDD